MYIHVCHRRVEGDETGDILAKEVAKMSFIGADSSCGHIKQGINKSEDNRMGPH